METLCDQLSVALESAQLYEDTRRRAERERLTSEITAKVRASNEPQVILSTAVSELRRALQASRAQVRLHSIKKPNHQATQAPPIPAEAENGNDVQTENP